MSQAFLDLKKAAGCKSLVKTRETETSPLRHLFLRLRKRGREAGRGLKDCSGRQCGGNGCAVAWV